jgi:Protein of unknown function (DUF2971)
MRMHGHKRLYYFTSSDIADRILTERRLKISLFNELNDPFELMYVSVGEKNMRRIAKFLQQHFAKTKGLICFSDNWRSPVMWAHYARKQAGVCIGFDITENPDILQPVRYESDRLKRPLKYDDQHLGLDVAFVQALLVTKAIEWSYENEYRVFSNLLYRDPATGFFYQSFGDEIRLREVIVGERNSNSLAHYKKQVDKPDHPVRIIKARAAFNDFAIVQNKAFTPVNVKSARR